jgi:CRISPR-associated protein Cst2
LRQQKETTLLYGQVSYTAYQYPFALALADCLPKREWTAALIKAIGQLSKVGGGDSVSHFQMAPRSIIVRLTKSLVAGYDNYSGAIAVRKLLQLPQIPDGVDNILLNMPRKRLRFFEINIKIKFQIMHKKGM